MTRATTAPEAGLISQVRELYDRGMVLDAMALAETHAPIAQWTGIDGCVTAARIARHAGSRATALRLATRALRENRQQAAAITQYAYEVMERRGPLQAWRLVRDYDLAQAETDVERAEILVLRALVSVDLRDFKRAEAFLTEAESLASDRAWVRLQRAHLLDAQDLVEEAVEVAKSAIDLHPYPYFRPGMQSLAQLLQQLDRDADAIALLQEANAAIQSAGVAGQLYLLLSENDRWEEAEEALKDFKRFSPLIGDDANDWFLGQRARAAHRLGHRELAAELAAQIDSDFYRAYTERLREPAPENERVHLPVTFVRQHFKTCAPATLAALARFWKMPGDHVDLAEAMCYDGTPSWEQRKWALANGWYVREFRVTGDAVFALVDRGVPFAISVVGATSAHMMAVIGVDRSRGTILLRDPGQPYVIEQPMAEFLSDYEAFGPHGMLFLPEAEAHRADGVELPDAAMYDEEYSMQVALKAHDRDAAVAALDRLDALAPDAMLTWMSRFYLACYDSNPTEQLRCLDRLLEMYPDNSARLLQRVGCMHEATREERLAYLEAACKTDEVDPALWVSLARTLLADARRHPETRRWLHRALRRRPADANVISALAALHWEEGERSESAELFRFAACLEGFQESYYGAWFGAARRIRRTEEVMVHLDDRFRRFGKRSEQPALTLAWAWSELEQPARSREILDEAIRLRPDDGQLKMRAASLLSMYEWETACAWMDGAQGAVRQTDWLRARMDMEERQGNTERALELARELLAQDPLALDALSTLLRCLSRSEGYDTAITHLREVIARFPHHYGLKRMLVEWSHGGDRDARLEAARELVRLEPTDAWARRELAIALTIREDFDEALTEVAEAARIEPRNSYSYSIWGHISRRAGDDEAARTHFRRAVELHVDHSDALHALLDLSPTDRERREQLEFIERQLVSQVIEGDGLLSYLDLARPVLEAEVLLQNLRDALAERPDLWHAWSAVVSQLVHMDQLDEAASIAVDASKRFPHLPKIWLELSMVYRYRGEQDAQIEAARYGFEINPACLPMVSSLAIALEHAGRMDEAREVYERALTHNPKEAWLHMRLANLHWLSRDAEAAFSALETTLRLDHDMSTAWDMFFDWTETAGTPERPLTFLRELAEECAGEPGVWMTLARHVPDAARNPEAYEAVDKAIELSRRSTDGWDLKAELLTFGERFDEAIAVCQEGLAACRSDTHLLRGRLAWIESRRRRFDEAIRLMRAELADNSAYHWGWTQLMQWHRELGQLDEAGEALEQLVRLQPHDAWVHRQLGLLRLQQDDDEGAAKAFATALQWSPTDESAANNLFLLQLDADDLEGAERTLSIMQTYQPGTSTLAAEINVRLRRNDWLAALPAFRTLCETPDPHPWAINNAVDRLTHHGHTERALGVVRDSMSGTYNPELGAAEMRLLLDEKRPRPWYTIWRLGRLPAGEVRTRAAVAFLNHHPDLGEKLALRAALLWHRDLFRSDDEAWGTVGYVLTNLDQPRGVVKWMSDWREREGVQPWMMFNYSLALQDMGKFDDAYEMQTFVLETWGHRAGATDMHLFLALESALRGHLERAADHHARADVRENSSLDKQLHALTKALIDCQSAAPSDQSQAFKQAKADLDELFARETLRKARKGVRRYFARSAKVFQQNGGGIGATLWVRWRLL